MWVHAEEAQAQFDGVQEQYVGFTGVVKERLNLKA